MPLPLPKSRADIARIQKERKKVAFLQAARAPFYAGKLAGIDPDRLDREDEWRKIPILDKEMLRRLADQDFYRGFCVDPGDGIAEYWRSGGATGVPLFYPRSFKDMEYALLSFARTFACIGCRPGEKAHISFPLGIHPAGQVFARCATQAGIAVNWAGAGTTTPSPLQLELIQRLQPTLWLGMSSYGLHLANLAEARGIDLASTSIETVICSAEPLSDAKREKLGRAWGARVYDTFGMTEAGMMGAEARPGEGFRIWTDMYFIEVLDPKTLQPVDEGEVGTLVVTALWTNNATPFLRWSSGDLVTYNEADDGAGAFSVFPRLKHAHRTTGFFKVRGINLGHQDLEDFIFRHLEISDFRADAVNDGGLDSLVLSIELRRGVQAEAILKRLVSEVKEKFEIAPKILVLESGTLAKEFEANVKAARFVDRRL